MVVLRATGEGRIQIHHVQAGRARSGKGARQFRRIAGIDLGAVAAALLQAHRLAIHQIDCRKNQHARTFYKATKRLSTAKPAR